MTAGSVVWITGLPSSGKSTLARRLHARLAGAGIACCILDGDEIRRALVPPPAYDSIGRDDFYATLGNLGVILAAQGVIVLIAATAHRRHYRERIRVNAERSFEVWVDVPLEECRRRDSKGLYRAFAEGRTRAVPGEDAHYEPPAHPNVIATGGSDENALQALTSLIAGSVKPG